MKLPSHVQIKGMPDWGYQSTGGSVLELRDADSECLLDITGTVGARISGLCLDGGNLGEEIHGICFGRDDFFDRTNTFAIEDCQVRRFSRNGLHLRLACCFAIRHCQGCRGQPLVGRDDAPEGIFSPKHSIVIEKLKGCVISSNTMWKASRREPIPDNGRSWRAGMRQGQYGLPSPTG